MNYIGLSLKKHDSQDTTNYIFNEVIETYETIILLGSPGSGKTSLLKKYQSEYEQTVQYVKVKELIKLNIQVDERATILLLDGLDEYRSTPGADRAFILTELGNKINKLEGKKVVISCREMDWYGETDKNSLQEQISKPVAIYRVALLDYKQKYQMSELLEIKEPQKFIEKFSQYGFLENPQMFSMMARIYKDNPSNTIHSKKGLYKTFIKIAREKNSDYKINKTNELETKEIEKYAGYLAFYYMFSDVEEFDEEFIDQICAVKQGYSRESIETVLKTALFSEKQFIHRTIAEFSLASFITEYKLKGNQSIARERVKKLFIFNGKIPTELRGVYAWLCSLTEDEELIQVDPYYQAIHGDNTLFTNELKKKIVLGIKEYAKKHPYFFEFQQIMELEGFYTTDMDGFLINEYNIALRSKKNHYIFFIINTIVSTPGLSIQMKCFLKKQIIDKTIPASYKQNMIETFQKDFNYLIQILDKIKDNELLDDDDLLKEELLLILYPEHIGQDEIAEYLLLYKNHVIGYCDYLYNTVYENKFTVIDNIFKLSYDKTKEPHLVLPENVTYFIEDYFYETVFKYEVSLDAEKIYFIINHFKKFYNWYNPLIYSSLRHSTTSMLENNREKIRRLSNQLFSLFIDSLIEERELKEKIYFFDSFFGYESPDQQGEILLDKIKKNNDPEINMILFNYALTFLKNTNSKLDQFKTVAQQYGLEQRLNEWMHPKKQEWELRTERKKSEREEKDKKIMKENEKYFSEKTDEQIRSKFGDLFFIAKRLFIDSNKEKDKYLTQKTFERLTGILKKVIFGELIDPELLTIQSLAINSPDAKRNIDTMYYVSCQLNNYTNIKDIKDEEFLKYLYINALVHSNHGNIINGEFKEHFDLEHTIRARAIIQEFISFLLDAHVNNYKDIFMPYITKVNDIKKLQSMAVFFLSEQDTPQDRIIGNFLKLANFTITIDGLKRIDITALNESNKNIVTALLTLTEGNKEKFTATMALALQFLISNDYQCFKQLKKDYKVKIIDFMMCQFTTEESIEEINGVQSAKNICVSFLRRSIFSNDLLDLDDFQSLENIRIDKEDVWTNRIADKVEELKQQKTDKAYSTFSIVKIKNYILSNAIVSKEDFFNDIVLKLEALRSEIEGDRDNDKKSFYNQDGSWKYEGACRDIILHRLKDKYGYDLLFTKEKYEADNRVDINIKYKANTNYEVQIECKRDGNSDIYKGIPEQLIHKYFSPKVFYGVLLIFYFGEKKDKNLLLKKIDDNNPVEYKNNIKVVCIDLIKKRADGQDE